MNKYLLLVVSSLSITTIAIPPELLKSYVPKSLLQILAEKTDWPEKTILEYPAGHLDVAFSHDAKYLLFSQRESSTCIEIDHLLNPEQDDSYLNKLWSLLGYETKQEPKQIATVPETEMPENEYLKKCLENYKKLTAVKQVLCSHNSNFLLVKELNNDNQENRQKLKLVDIREFAKFAQDIAYNYRYKDLFKRIEAYYEKSDFWFIEQSPYMNHLFKELPEQIQEHLCTVVIRR